ncbi:unnamed protein product [Closterium sp. Naga37s-1]|nr:unnamed protein product [Closterium sp. Naga37s-1]
MVPVLSVQGGEQPFDRSVDPAGINATMALPPLCPSLAADLAPIGPEIVRDHPNKTLLLHQNAYVAKVQQLFFKGAPPKKQLITPLSSSSFVMEDAELFADSTMTDRLAVAEPAADAGEEVWQRYWADRVAYTRWIARDATSQFAICTHLSDFTTVADLTSHLRSLENPPHD